MELPEECRPRMRGVMPDRILQTGPVIQSRNGAPKELPRISRRMPFGSPFCQPGRAQIGFRPPEKLSIGLLKSRLHCDLEPTAASVTSAPGMKRPELRLSPSCAH
jgi:hypothetical protein